MKTSKPFISTSSPNGESSSIPKWEAKVARLSQLRDIKKDDEIGIVMDILMNKYEWSYKIYSHRIYSSKEKVNVPLTQLKHHEDYFETEDEVKAYVHKNFGWVGPKGKEYIPPSSKRIRKKATIYEVESVPNPEKRHKKTGKVIYEKEFTKDAKLFTPSKKKNGPSVQDTVHKTQVSVAEKIKSSMSSEHPQEVHHDLITPTPIFSSNRVTLQNLPSTPQRPPSRTFWV